MTVDERFAHIEILSHAHHRVIYGAVAVRVILTHAVADDSRALFMRFVGRQSHFVHRVEDSSLHGFKSVLHSRQSTVQNDEFRIGKHGRMKNFFEGLDIKLSRGFLLFGLFLTPGHLRPPSSLFYP